MQIIGGDVAVRSQLDLVCSHNLFQFLCSALSGHACLQFTSTDVNTYSILADRSLLRTVWA